MMTNHGQRGMQNVMNKLQIDTRVEIGGMFGYLMRAFILYVHCFAVMSLFHFIYFLYFIVQWFNLAFCQSQQISDVSFRRDQFC